MAQGIYKNGEHINLVYQAAGGATSLTPTGLVYDEAGATHTVETTALNSSLTAGELGDGAYAGGFQPDAEGYWVVVIDDGTGDGTASKGYQVCGFNIDSIGDSIPSQLLLTKSNLVSAVKADVDAMVTSQLLLTKSSLVSAILVDTNASTSDVKSAVLTTTSPAAIS